MLPLSTILILDFRIVLTACYILFFIFCYHWIRYGYVPLVVNGHFLIHHRFVTRLTRRVALFDQELLTLPVHLSSLPVFSEVRVTRSLVVCVCFVDRCLSFCTFSFAHFVVCSSSIYGFWLPLWYLHTLLILIIRLKIQPNIVRIKCVADNGFIVDMLFSQLDLNPHNWCTLE
jgi:hypothetical protein